MVLTFNHDIDRQFHVELGALFRFQRDALDSEFAVNCGAGNVFNQSRHFSVAGQLTQQRAKRFVHLLLLQQVRFQVRSLGRFVLIVGAKIDFLLGSHLQFRALFRKVEVITTTNDQHHQDQQENAFQRGRPRADIVEVQLRQIDALQLFD